MASTNDVARELASAGAPAGTVVTAAEQSAGRGRQGRAWSAPPGAALLLSVILRDFDALLPLRAAVAVAECVDGAIKWPNDVLLDGRKLAGILAEARPAEGWAVLGIGVNVAVRVADLPPELHATAATLGRAPDDVEPFAQGLLRALEDVLAAPAPALRERWAARDALCGQTIGWNGGTGVARGVDATGALLVDTPAGPVALDAGEVHLQR